MDSESTSTLLAHVRRDDPQAREKLVERFLPHLRRWAMGRLPQRARSLLDTDDLVQLTFLRALKRVKEFDSHRKGAFFSYLRTILRNQIRDEIRRTNRKPATETLDERIIQGRGPSVIEEAVGSDLLEIYEAALKRLGDNQQAAVMLRIEMGLTYSEVADALDCPSENAARMMVTRAIIRLSEEMR